MKQFQKYGVAAAVASVATGVVATEVSKNEAGDLAIVPYYTVLDGQNTGIHVINTTDRTQVVKVRLRRGADSKDALDFNLVMSPYDEWTANIGAGGETGVQVTTNDTTCTVPEFPNGVAQMPSAFAEGATEGYVEIMAMAQTSPAMWETVLGALDALVGDETDAELAEANSIAQYAKHKDGVPVSCALVRENFYRISGGTTYDIVGTGDTTSTAAAKTKGKAVAGVHTSQLTSNGVCTTTALASTASVCYQTATEGEGAATAGSIAALLINASNMSMFEDSDDDALKVSWMITDSDGGLEIGDNAVHVEGFAEAAMMTNQQPLGFTTAGSLIYDPLNFELPNLAYGAWPSSVTAREADGAATTTGIGSGVMFDDLRDALNADALINDWAGFEAADGSVVATDWVITVPGQYIMNNPICDFYGNYPNAKTAAACAKAATATGFYGYGTATNLNNDELPLLLAGSSLGIKNAYNTDSSNLVLWDREEADQAPERETTNPGLGFSPAGEGSAATPKAYLLREVNVVSFNDGDVLSSADLQDEDYGLRVVVNVPEASKGWGVMEIQGSSSGKIWHPDAEDDGDPVAPNTCTKATTANAATCTTVDTDKDNWGYFEDVREAGKTMAIGFAAWERSFADQAGNYGRAIEHTTVGARSDTMDLASN